MRPPLAHGATVLRQITKVIGIRPSRTDLIQITEHRNWTTLTRTDRRLKCSVVAKLDPMREQILPELETVAGVQALQDAYRAIIQKERLQRPSPPTPVGTSPDVAAISFYLNHPNTRFQ
jgi:hypothetical protein